MRKDKQRKFDDGLCIWSGCTEKRKGSYCEQHEEYFRSKAKAARQRRKSMGLCTTCGKRKRLPGLTKCKKCSEFLQAWQLEKRSDQTRCLYCPAEARVGKRSCEECAVARKSARDRLRLEVIAAYGGKCECCSETRIEFLQIDHVNKDGAAHRKELNSPGSIYRWVKENGYPKSCRVLCANCNFSYGAYGYCPHQKEARNELA